jgi:hypothetical protein
MSAVFTPMHHLRIISFNIVVFSFRILLKDEIISSKRTQKKKKKKLRIKCAEEFESAENLLT